MKTLSLCFVLVCSLLAASAAGQTVNMTVYPYSGNGPADLVSNAVPFKPGVLFDAINVRVLDGATEVPLAAKVLARWPQDNSIRSVLLQFGASFSTASKNYTLQIGTPRQTADRPFTAVTWDLPTRIFTLPAAYLGESLVFWEQKPLGQAGFSAWDNKQVANYSRIETVGTAACVRDDNYYDATTTTYQLYARTGELKYLVNARKWALHHRRDQVYLSGTSIGHPKCSGAYLNNTRYTFPQALVSDYFMFGDEEAKRVSGIIVDNFYMPHADTFYYKAPNTRGWWTEREPAFSLIGTLAHYEATGNTIYLDKIKQRITSLHKMQVDNGRRAWVHNLYDHDPSESCAPTDYGSSPWMSGLLLEAIVEYHKLTGDPIARESILMALDDIKARYLATGAYRGVSFVYLGCPYWTSGAPDLDNLISHAFGYGYKITGRTDYLTVGKNIFNTSVANGVTASHKHYDQQFRSSGRFVAYVTGDVDSGTPPPPPPPAGSDATAPTVSVAPLPAVVGGVITITANAADNVGVAGVQFLIDGTASGAEDTASPWALQIDTDLLNSGSHTVTARARDAAGNSTTSAAVSFIVDNGIPVVTITSPAAGTAVGASFTASATVTDRNAIAGVQFLIDSHPQGTEDTAAPYSVTVDASTLASGTHTLLAVARDVAGNKGTASVTFTGGSGTGGGTAPGTTIYSVVNAATYGSNLACSPNALVSIFGKDLTPGGIEGATAIPLPGQILGVSVKADGVQLPLLWVSPDQINFQCPDRTSGQRMSITVERTGQVSAPVEVTEQFATPGIFSMDSSGKGQGAILIANTDKIAMRTTVGIPSRPAIPGDYISIFGTGLGPIRAPVAAGVRSPAGDGSRVTAPVGVTIGGMAAQVTYAGLAPGWVGLYQVNARVPSNIGFGDAVPVVIQVTDPGGQVVSSNTVTISVQPAP